MNQKKIERKLKELCNDSNLFFQHGANAGKILWYDNEDKVYISPMPIETFN
jgi:hypothetical protein